MTKVALLLQSWDDILQFIANLQNTGISWGAVITVFILWGKIMRNKRYHERDIRMEKKIDAIMEKVGAECASLTVTESSTKSFKMSSISRSVVLSVVRIAERFTNYLIGRKTIMEKLKSRKFWLAILGALIPIINIEFGLNLDTNTVISILGFLAVSIASLAHVDAKKAALQQVTQPTQPSDPNKFIQG